jgi:hypothetical protein
MPSRGHLKANDALFEFCNRFAHRSAVLSEHLTDGVDQSSTLGFPPLTNPYLDALVNALINFLPVLLPPSGRQISGSRDTAG